MIKLYVNNVNEDIVGITATLPIVHSSQVIVSTKQSLKLTTTKVPNKNSFKKLGKVNLPQAEVNKS